MNADWSHSLTQALALTLVHFLWQASLVGGATAGLLQVVQPRAARTRYAVYCATMLLLAACPALTFAILLDKLSPADRTVGLVDASTLVVPGYELTPELPDPATPQTDAWTTAARAVAAWIEQNPAVITVLWLAGVTLLGTRLLLGAFGSMRVASAAEAAPAAWLERAEHLARRMGFRAVPAVRVSSQVSQAMAVGIIRPLVLLPAAWTSGVTGDVLEAVLAHELAHLRRYDLAINTLQRLVEVLLFFHPLVWWCSRQMRIEREMCCDELALVALGDRAVYAKALTYLAQQQSPVCEPLWGVGMGGPQMVLLKRIRNVLGVDGNQRGRLYGPVCALVGAALASFLWAAALAYRTSTQIADLSESEQLDWGENKFPLGHGVGSDAGLTGHVAAAPTEHAKRVLPNYTIEPPDVLLIDVARVVAKEPHKLQAGNELQIIVEPPEANLASRGFFVDGQGRIDLGPRFGKVDVAGLTSDEATEAVRKIVDAVHKNAAISLTIVQSDAMQPIAGEHLVSPDGTVNLGTYGQVYVAGMTLPEAKTAIEKHLAEFLDHPQASVSVFAYNSKVYYVIVEGGGRGDMVTRLPITGNETVLDAISQIQGLSPLSRKQIWIARPAPGGASHDQVLRVNWQQITKGAATATNYQVLPGDRIFVVDQVATKPARY
ncbi:MAG: M56 family metallopeptidase [Pirellulales bacterium]